MTYTPLTDYSEMLDSADLAKIFNVSKDLIQDQMRQGYFGSLIVIGRRKRVPKSYVLDKFFTNYQ